MSRGNWTYMHSLHVWDNYSISSEIVVSLVGRDLVLQLKGLVIVSVAVNGIYEVRYIVPPWSLFILKCLYY